MNVTLRLPLFYCCISCVLHLLDNTVTRQAKTTWHLKVSDPRHIAFLQLLTVQTRQERPSIVEAQEDHLLRLKCCHRPVSVQTVA